jgi:hypothetical protein
LQTFTGSSAAGFLLMSVSLILAGGLLLGVKPLPETHLGLEAEAH